MTALDADLGAILDEPLWYPDGADPDDYDALLAYACANYYTLGQADAEVPDTPAWRHRLTTLAAAPLLELWWREGDDGVTLRVFWYLPCGGAVQPVDLRLPGWIGGRLDMMTLHAFDGDLETARSLAGGFAAARVTDETARLQIVDDEHGRRCLTALAHAGYDRDCTGGPAPRFVDGGGLTAGVWHIEMHANTFSDAAVRWAVAVERAQARLDGATPRPVDDPAFTALPLGPGARRRRDNRAPTAPASPDRATRQPGQTALF